MFFLFSCGTVPVHGIWFTWILKGFVSNMHVCAKCCSSDLCTHFAVTGYVGTQGMSHVEPALPHLLLSQFSWRAFLTSMLSSFFFSIVIYHVKNQGRDGATYFRSRTTSGFCAVSTMLKGRFFIWCYMDPGGGVCLQMQLHLPHLQGCSKQVGGPGSINSVY